MEQVELAVFPRSVIGKQVSGLRRQGLVPAILYGRHMSEPMVLQVEARVFRKILSKVGTSQLLKLSIEGRAEPQIALVREVQREPISGNFYHVDFLAVSMTEKIRLYVPVLIEGVSPPVARNEGIVLQTMDEIEIECLPGDLVDALRVDVSKLTEVGMEFNAGDMAALLGGRIQILVDPDETVVRIAPVREEKIEEVVVPVEAPEVEVITKGKVEEEAAEE